MKQHKLQLLISVLAFGLIAGLAYIAWPGSGLKLLSVQSGSMAPSINRGALVFVRSVELTELNQSDVITFEHGETTVTHRLVDMTRAPSGHTALITKGDANPTRDDPIDSSRLVGRVDAHIPLLGYIADTLRNPYFLILLVYVPALLIIANEMLILFREIERIRASEAQHQEAEALYANTKVVPTKDGEGKVENRIPVLRSTNSLYIIMAVAAAGIVCLKTFSSLLTSANLQANTISALSEDVAAERISICIFPDHEALLSYAEMDALYPETSNAPIALSQPVPAGSYRAELESRDTSHAATHTPMQPNERWQAWFYSDGSSEPLTKSGFTDDLPDNETENVTTTDNTITFEQDVNGIRFAHEAYTSGLEIDSYGGRNFDELSFDEKRRVLWNSIHPECINLYPSDDEPDEATPSPTPSVVPSPSTTPTPSVTPEPSPEATLSPTTTPTPTVDNPIDATEQ